MKFKIMVMYFHQETDVEPVLHPRMTGTKPAARIEMAAPSKAPSSTTPTQETVSPAHDQGTRLIQGNTVQPGELQ